jgi:hypothetical protein
MKANCIHQVFSSKQAAKNIRKINFSIKNTRNTLNGLFSLCFLLSTYLVCVSKCIIYDHLVAGAAVVAEAFVCWILIGLQLQ